MHVYGENSLFFAHLVGRRTICLFVHTDFLGPKKVLSARASDLRKKNVTLIFRAQVNN